MWRFFSCFLEMHRELRRVIIPCEFYGPVARIYTFYRTVLAIYQVAARLSLLITFYRPHGARDFFANVRLLLTRLSRCRSRCLSQVTIASPRKLKDKGER